VLYVQDYHLDGINIDIEGPAFTDDVVQGINSLTKEAYTALKHINPSYLVTWDVTYSPFLAGCLSGYCYDWATIANYSDYVIAMDYDATLDVLFASANSPYNLIKEGYVQYIEQLKISPNKFVMAVPWYGYNYTCSRFYNHTGDNLCIIADAAHSQIALSVIMQLYEHNIGGLKWNDKYKSPYFVIKEAGLYHEIWFDNVESLELKFDLAVSFGLKGLGMWRADALDYDTNNVNVAKFNSELWNSINYYVSKLKK
jgi:di-N-acetylchitobiase